MVMFHSYVTNYQAGYFWPWNLSAVDLYHQELENQRDYNQILLQAYQPFFAACNVLSARMPVPLQRDLRFWVADEVDERHLAGVIGFCFEKGQKSHDISFISVICGATHENSPWLRNRFIGGTYNI